MSDERLSRRDMEETLKQSRSGTHSNLEGMTFSMLKRLRRLGRSEELQPDVVKDFMDPDVRHVIESLMTVYRCDAVQALQVLELNRIKNTLTEIEVLLTEDAEDWGPGAQ